MAQAMGAQRRVYNLSIDAIHGAAVPAEGCGQRIFCCFPRARKGFRGLFGGLIRDNPLLANDFHHPQKEADICQAK